MSEVGAKTVGVTDDERAFIAERRLAGDAVVTWDRVVFAECARAGLPAFLASDRVLSGDLARAGFTVELTAHRMRPLDTKGDASFIAPPKPALVRLSRAVLRKRVKMAIQHLWPNGDIPGGWERKKMIDEYFSSQGWSDPPLASPSLSTITRAFKELGIA